MRSLIFKIRLYWFVSIYIKFQHLWSKCFFYLANYLSTSGVSCTILVETLKCMAYWMQFLQVQLTPELVKILLWYARYLACMSYYCKRLMFLCSSILSNVQTKVPISCHYTTKRYSVTNIYLVIYKITLGNKSIFDNFM